MSDITIHNIHMSYDEGDERVRDFVKYLKGEGKKEEFRAYYEEARNSGKAGKIYLSDQFGNDFTLECTGEHNCRLGLRGMEY